MKIVTIIGARPQFIKAATISRVLKNYPGIKEIIVHTGQHYDENMSEIFFKQMEIPVPDFNLGINSLTHGSMTGEMLIGIEKIIIKEKPDWVLVYGDTNSTLAGALAASKLGIKLAHVEAGLRSYNMNMPEEINRIVADRLANVNFCPTQNAYDNLMKEGYRNINSNVVIVGDVMYDAALYYSKKDIKLTKELEYILSSDFILCTVHRQENTDNLENLINIFNALNEISKTTKVVLPLHPRTKKIIEKNNIKLDFQTIEPVGYLEMIKLLQNCKLVITDSGGLQKEAYFFKKVCITLREETEWVELVNCGYNLIVGTDGSKILKAFINQYRNSLSFCNNLYGNGSAAINILSQINEGLRGLISY